MSTVKAVLAEAVAELGGTHRPGQEQMAEAVADALEGKRHLLVQAGTGTGKSLAYLVPALLHENRVIIATATLNLQRQLVDRDIPALKAAAASVGDGFAEHAVLKGRANYACLHRVRQGAPDDQGVLLEVPEGSLGKQVVQLRDWAEDQASEGGSGDRDDAPSHVDLAWRQISVSARECLGAAKCEYGQQCFAELARQEANDAHLVVTNHAMLAIDAVEGVPMLPEYDAVIIDEAHELAARVTQASTDELDPGMVERAAARARPHLDADKSSAEQDLSDAAEALADALTHVSPGRIENVESALGGALALVRDSARACFSAFEKDSPESADPARQMARTAVDDVRRIAERMAANQDADVIWLGQGRSSLQLRIAPLDVSASLREKLFETKTVVLTSATLTLGGDFGPVARSLGLDRTGANWTGIDVGSPFDYQKQGILYIAKHLPPPGRDGLEIDQLGEITALIKAAGGRTLGLFSSRRGAERAAEYVRKALPELTVLCQGDAQLPELAQQFADEPSTCLFGTLSLWQGVDLPGDTCTLVIIDRIPFPRPDDPLMSARQKRVDQSGGNGFMQVAAQHAALLMAQGVGRLIRRTDDRGVVAVLDPRLVTARYGPFLISSLPNFWRTTDRNQVIGSLNRLDINREN